jgi:hypothetical protein
MRAGDFPPVTDGQNVVFLQAKNDASLVFREMTEGLDRAEFLEGFILWKGWSHASTEEVPS